MALHESADETAAEPQPADPREDGRTRCTWVAGRPAHYAFHDAEYGMVPDDELLACERLLLACFQRSHPLADVLDHRDEIHAALCGWDLAKIAALDDGALGA